MPSYHKYLSYRNYEDQSVGVIFSGIVIAVAACKHPQREFDIHQTKFIAFAWDFLHEAADWNRRLDRKYDYVIEKIRRAEQKLQLILDLEDIEGYTSTKPTTQEECRERIRLYASWILRQVFVIGEKDD